MFKQQILGFIKSFVKNEVEFLYSYLMVYLTCETFSTIMLTIFELHVCYKKFPLHLIKSLTTFCKNLTAVDDDVEFSKVSHNIRNFGEHEFANLHNATVFYIGCTKYYIFKSYASAIIYKVDKYIN